MARSRNIKPAFFSNEDLAEVSPEARLLFAGLWTIADRKGRLEDRPKRIRGELFPYDTWDCDDLLNQLASINVITRYAVDGRNYILVNNFLKHQNPHPKEKDSDIPGVPCNYTASREKELARNASSLIPSSLIPDSLTHESLNSDPLVSLEPQADSKPAAEVEQEELADVDPYPCVGQSKQYRLTQSLMATWVKAYPNLDVLAEMRKAQAWCVANASNRKTASGMPKFLNGWLSTATNGINRGPPRPPPPKPPTSRLSDQLRERMAKR